MSSNPLSTLSLLDLIDLFEQSGEPIADGDGQRLHGVPAWDLARRTAISDHELATWTECVGYAGSYPAPCGDERVIVEIEEDEDPSRYRYRCPETFRLKFVLATEVAVHAIRTTMFLEIVADLLSMPQALRKGIHSPAIDGVLWFMGKARIADVMVDVWLVRGLSASIDRVFEHFRVPSLPDQGLILTTGLPLPDIIQPPRAYRIIPITTVLVSYAVEPHLDIDLIHRLLVAPSGGKVEKSLPVRFDQYTNTLVITTKSLKLWAIKGKRQVAVAKYLFKQFVNGRRWVPAHEILNAVYGSREAARGKRVPNIFSGNSVWEDYIANDGNGQYGFNLD